MNYIVSNYHAHTTRCNHAFDTEKEYIEEAIKCGIKEFGFSDHAPVPYEKEYVSGMRMPIEQTREYVDTIRSLAKEYEKDIKIYVGFEAEYLPQYFNEQMQIYDEIGIDYLILGQHFNKSERIGPYNAYEMDDEALLKEYVDVVIEAAKTGRYMYIAHPDIFNFTGDDAVYKKEMTRLCQAMKDLSIPLEINMLGAFTNRNYPCNRFFEIAGNLQNDVIIGLDAHCKDQVYNPDGYKKCMDLVKRNGLHLLERVDVK